MQSKASTTATATTNTRLDRDEQLYEHIKPILERLKADMDDMSSEKMGDYRFFAKIPFKGVGTGAGSGSDENKDNYTFTLKDADKKIKEQTIHYERDGKKNSFTLSEIERLEHFLTPVYIRIKLGRTLFTEVSANDINVRLHLLLPGDVFISISRVVYEGAGIQKTQDIYVVR